ncbi:MAG: pyruvate kinase [Pseudomonadota bacterium]
MPTFEPRHRKVRIIATLGPASVAPEMIRALFEAGVDVFRINMSHGDYEDKARAIAAIRALEKKLGRPQTILADLQGPKLRIGRFADGPVALKEGARFVLDLDPSPGTAKRVNLPHPEIFSALSDGAILLLDDGRIRLKVEKLEAGRAISRVVVGGTLSDRKGVNVPGAVLPLAALTEKDRRDLEFALEQKADWIALSFVQRPEDVAEVRKIVAGRAGVLAKIEKPAALTRLDEILDQADAVMVARGDLGVELPMPEVPPVQKAIIAAARARGKMVVVATQMLESMVASPAPTRAEVSDVANAVYEGADAVMLSAESAVGQYPVEAVRMMDAIARRIESDAGYHRLREDEHAVPERTAEDAISAAARQVVATVGAKAIVTFTTSGSTARRAARERPAVPVIALTPKLETARRLGLVWGLHCIHTKDVSSFEEMVGKAKRMALRSRLASGGDRIVITAGVPFGTPGSTNVLKITWLQGNELDQAKSG